MALKICTFRYARNNFNNFKIVGQTIPDTLECMTKTDVTNLLNIVPNSLNSYANNRLIPIINIKASIPPAVKIGFNNTVTSIERTSDNLLDISGAFTNYNDNPAYFKISVGLDGITSYGSSNWGTGTNGSIDSFFRYGNYIAIGGAFDAYNGTPSKGLIFLNKDYTIFKTFDLNWSGGLSMVSTIDLMPDNTLIVGGTFRKMDSTQIGCIVKLTSSGLRDTSFNYNIINSNVNDIKVLNNKIYVASDIGIRILNLDGTIYSGFNYGTNLNGAAKKVLPLSDGSMFVIGQFTTYKGQSANRIVKLLDNGSIDPSFQIGTGFNNVTDCIEIIANQIYIGGKFSSYNGQNCNSLVRLNFNGTFDTNFITGTGFYAGGSIIYINTLLYVPEINAIYVGGRFTSYDGIVTYHIVILNLDGSVFRRYDVNNN